MSVRAVLHFVQTFGGITNGDRVDTCHSLTANLLLTFAVITSAKNFLGSPFQCATSSSMPTSWTKVLRFLFFSQFPLTSYLTFSTTGFSISLLFLRDRVFSPIHFVCFRLRHVDWFFKTHFVDVLLY
ncbi:hypothetical protein M3Y94_00169900 [Aphelenchoides besseyi]|nr:hypothetical protein M3Y94_00169900 [Aphelenchoides besseyi]